MKKIYCNFLGVRDSVNIPTNEDELKFFCNYIQNIIEVKKSMLNDMYPEIHMGFMYKKIQRGARLVYDLKMDVMTLNDTDIIVNVTVVSISALVFNDSSETPDYIRYSSGDTVIKTMEDVEYCYNKAVEWLESVTKQTIQNIVAGSDSDIDYDLSDIKIEKENIGTNDKVIYRRLKRIWYRLIHLRMWMS